MISSEEFNQFCKEHLKEAQEYADQTIGAFVKAHGSISRRYDVENVKQLAVLSALEKAYLNFDPSKSKDKTVSPLLKTIVSRDVNTELGKEGTAVDRFNGIKRRKVKEEAFEDGSSIMPGISFSGINGRLFEPHEYLDIFGSTKGKEQQKKELRKAYKKLSLWDQRVLHYWMCEEQDNRAYIEAGEKPQRTYIQRTLDELGLDKSYTNAFAIRCFKAKKKLAALMQGVPVDYQDIYVPGSSRWKNIEEVSDDCVTIYSEEQYDTIVDKMYKNITEK